MRPAGIRAVLLVVAIVVAAAGAGLWASHGTASAQTPAASTITTELRPAGTWSAGWAPTRRSMICSGRSRRYNSWRLGMRMRAATPGAPDGKTPSSLEQLPRGQGLYLRLAGTETVQWTRPAAEGVVLLRLHAGHNLVTWGGPDGTPIEEALDWLGDAVVSASRWNADTGESERYRPGASASANTLRTLNHGDALWVRLSEDASWWQSGTAGTEFVFEEPLHPVTEAALRDEVARVLAFFHEVYGMEPLDLSVVVDPSLKIGGLAYPGKIVYSPSDLAASESQPHFSFAHEYFHVFQWEFRMGEHSARASRNGCSKERPHTSKT